MAGGKLKRQKADCRADTRGGSWAGIPKALIDSAAYRALSLHARAVLVELTARMNGYNNGQIAASQRELKTALGCTPRYIVAAIAELMDHGILDVTCEGAWKARQARQYRLTFVSTKAAPATNDYLRWTPPPKKSGASHGEAEKGKSASHGEPRRSHPASYGEAARVERERKTADFQIAPASHGEPLIYKPYPPAPAGERKGDSGSSGHPLPAKGLTLTDRQALGLGEAGDQRACEQCGDEFILERSDRTYPRRFCGETCRTRAERARCRVRGRTTGEDGETIGQVLNGSVARLLAGARA